MSNCCSCSSAKIYDTEKVCVVFNTRINRRLFAAATTPCSSGSLIYEFTIRGCHQGVSERILVSSHPFAHGRVTFVRFFSCAFFGEYGSHHARQWCVIRRIRHQASRLPLHQHSRIEYSSSTLLPCSLRHLSRYHQRKMERTAHSKCK